MRQYTGVDKLIHSFDQALRSLVPGTTSSQRENPAKPVETQLNHPLVNQCFFNINLSITNVS